MFVIVAEIHSRHRHNRDAPIAVTREIRSVGGNETGLKRGVWNHGDFLVPEITYRRSNE